jgi:hypothetical protein
MIWYSVTVTWLIFLSSCVHVCDQQGVGGWSAGGFAGELGFGCRKANPPNLIMYIVDCVEDLILQMT